MNNHKTFSTRWRLPLLFFFLLSSVVSSAYAETAVYKYWSKPAALASTTLDFAGTFTEKRVDQSKIITNKNGKAFAVWTEYPDVGSFDTTSSAPRPGIEYSYWSSYFDGANWNNSIKIKGISTSESTSVPEIIFDGNGDVLATWTESTRMGLYGSTPPIVFASRFDSRNLDWGSPIQLTYDNSGSLIVIDLRIASRDNGMIHSIWGLYDYDSSRSGLWSSVFNGNSWNNPTKIHETPTFEDYRTKIDPIFSNYNNDLMSVHLADSGDENYMMGVFANHFNGSNWSSPQRLGSDAIFASGLKAGFDKNGNAIAVWREITTDYRELFLASHFDRSSRTWSPAVLIAENKGGDSPQIAFNDNGNASVVWKGYVWQEGQEYVSGEEVLWVSQFNGNNWETPFRIDSMPWRGGVIKVRDVTLDNSNHIHVAWLKSVNGNNRVWANSFDGNNWGTAKFIDVGKNEIIDTPSDIPLKKVRKYGTVDVVIDSNGNAHALEERIVGTWEREEPNSSSPWKETKTKTILTSQLKAHIVMDLGLVYTPYGGFVVLIGANFMNVVDADNDVMILKEGNMLPVGLLDGSTYSLVDQNGNAPLGFYVWRTDVIVAQFRDIPESVTLMNPNGEEVVLLERY